MIAPSGHLCPSAMVNEARRVTRSTRGAPADSVGAIWMAPGGVSGRAGQGLTRAPATEALHIGLGTRDGQIPQGGILYVLQIGRRGKAVRFVQQLVAVSTGLPLCL